ncbi:putative dinucleotide-binding enzyme [Pseudarthrobacter defluvii]|uniref:NADPH-dependent F420 reductase n=1 Tax=Pseudarthrobacter defluvii TaxID=410837 RepID=UPI0027850436|nr:NAD(P)-binding domain-containing protein [Pseudarthrobacter defluvii]MDQ0770679.1 putative dinucleotide-binding enzyme [Pseudarthrobacter defluvii]
MRIAVLGTGTVGRTLAAALGALGHQVVLGTRDPGATAGRTSPDPMGGPPFKEWLAAHGGIGLGTFAEAAGDSELVVNATNGAASLAALGAAGAARLAGKVLVDVSNPLDFSQGMPPVLNPVNTESLGERIQRSFPETRVVKSLNTMNAGLMVDPRRVAGGDHSVFISGDDAGAKTVVRELLESLGHKDIIDLGDITTARGAEMVLPLWLRLFGVLGTPDFNFKIVRG